MANPYEYRGSGQGFLDDYSSLGAAAGAFQGFSEAFERAQDAKQKRLEQQAQVEALKSKAQRENFQNKADAWKNHMQVDEDGNVSERPMTQQEQLGQNTKVFAAGGMQDPNDPTKIVTDPNSLKAQQIKAQQDLAKRRIDVQDKRFGLQEQKFEEQQSQNAAKAGKDITEEPLMKDFATSRASLSRGRNLLKGNTPLTFKNLNAVQQDVINGMTKGGVSSEGKIDREMQDSWIGHWNDLMHKAGVYGEGVDIRKQDPGLAKQIGDLLEDVDSSVAKNAADRATLLNRNYSQHSNKKLQKTVKDVVSQFTQPQGMISPTPLQQNAGTLSGQAPQEQAPAPHPQDNAALKWAKDHPDDPRAAKILRANGL